MKGLFGKYRQLERKEPEEEEKRDNHREVEEGNSKKRLRSAEEKLVDFLIIGAQKAGTTALAKNLNKHPEIFVKNECQFFTFCWDYGVDWYRKQLRTPKRLIGEKTPEIIYCDDCARRVQEVCPQAKFILCLRDPVKRAYSSWNMEIQTKRESASFSDCIERELSSMMNERRTYGTAEYHFIQRGFYMDQIERFQRLFPNKDQMLILIAEKLHHSPSTEYSKVLEFLGASDFTFLPEDDNVGDYRVPEMNEKTKQKLREIYASHNQRLFQYLGVDSIPEWEEDYIAPAIPSEPITTAVRKQAPLPMSSTAATISFSTTLSHTSDDGAMARLGTQTGTDKITHHGYHRYYPLYLERFRAITEPWAMMEIGVDQSKSLEMWKKYFPSNVFVYGLDIGVSSQGDRFHIFKADQSKPEELHDVVTSIQSSSSPCSSPIHFILDDGSHIPEHQILTFDSFFSTLLTPGGVYIIEDIETSYWGRGGLYGYSTHYGYHHDRSLVEIFKDLVDDVNNEFLNSRSRERQDRSLAPILSHETRASIGSITFGQNCVIVVKKTREEVQRYNGREYRYRKNLGNN